MSADAAFAVVRSWMASKLNTPKAVIDALQRYIGDKAVSFREMADLAAHTVIGRDSATAGTPQAVSITGGLEFTGTGGIQRSALTGDVTASAGSGVTTIAPHAVTNPKFRQSAGLSLVGNSTNATADVADITAASDGQVMRRSGTAIAFGAVNLASANAITGNLPVANLNSGTGAGSTTFWCGNNTWAVPPGSGGTVTSVSSANGDLTVATGTTTPVLTINSAPKLDTARTFSYTGDATGGPTSFDGSGNVSTALTLANTAVTAGSYTNANITIDAKGRITLAANGSSGTGTVTHTVGALTSGQLIFGNGAADLKVGDLSGDVTTSGSGVTAIKSNVALAGSPTTTTQAAGDNSTKIATDAFVTTAIANAIAGVNPAVAVQAATTAAANTSGYTYNNGASGIGATLTGVANTALTVDGYTFTALGQRLLVKNDTQSPSGAYNGVYYVTQVQTVLLPVILTRALDYDMPSDINNTGAIPVVNGTVNALTSWLLTSQVVTVGTDPLTYTQFSVNPAATQTANFIYAGPTTGAAAAPTFRAMVTADIPNSTVTLAKIANAAASSKLLGSGASGSGAAYTEVSLGTGLSMVSTTLTPAVGSSSQLGIVQVDGTTITASGGILSATTSSGGMALIATATPTGTNTFTFSSIPGTYKHLRILGAGRSLGAGTGTDFVFLQFNADTGANYARQSIISNSSTGSPTQNLGTGNTAATIGEFPKAGDVANYQGSIAIDILLYNGAVFAKTWQGQYVTLASTTISSLFLLSVVGSWNNTSAITSITIFETSNFVTGTTFSLYGYN